MHPEQIQYALTNVLLLWMLTAPHEFAHAWVATRLGDDTPRRDGRVTLNPLAHVDWIGTALLPFVTSLTGGGFLGWGRPVSTNPAKLRGGLNGLALVALAGPVSNIVMAVLLAAAAIATIRAAPGLSGFLQRGVLLSIYLALFNLLPVPPLDGSKLLLAARIPIVLYRELARAGFLVLVVLMVATSLGRYLSLLSVLTADAIFRALAFVL
ncbi:MAG: site-2 protease family protein [Bryobacteraceae bacterium]